MIFFVGLHQPSDAHRFQRAFVSVNRLRGRKSDFRVNEWIMDSGAFTTIATHGGYPHPVDEYAEQINRWSRCGTMLAAVAQDYMCEPVMLARTGLTVPEHQYLTVRRYDDLLPMVAAPVMPVLQGYAPEDYGRHVEMYGARLAHGAWVGVGSVCKRNGNPGAIVSVLRSIKEARPDLRLHGFGLKATALAHGAIRDNLYSADSMAWSFAARRAGRNSNDWQEAARFAQYIETMPVQKGWLI